VGHSVEQVACQVHVLGLGAGREERRQGAHIDHAGDEGAIEEVMGSWQDAVGGVGVDEAVGDVGVDVPSQDDSEGVEIGDYGVGAEWR
jgi:hypothetical protein